MVNRACEASERRLICFLLIHILTTWDPWYSDRKYEVITFVVNGIWNELAAMQDSSMVLGRWDPGLDSKLDLSKSSNQAPVWSTYFYISHHRIGPESMWDRHATERRLDHSHYCIDFLAPICWSSAMHLHKWAILVLTLQRSGIKRRATLVLHGLRVIESYLALDRSEKPPF